MKPLHKIRINRILQKLSNETINQLTCQNIHTELKHIQANEGDNIDKRELLLLDRLAKALFAMNDNKNKIGLYSQQLTSVIENKNYDAGVLLSSDDELIQKPDMRIFVMYSTNDSEFVETFVTIESALKAFYAKFKKYCSHIISTDLTSTINPELWELQEILCDKGKLVASNGFNYFLTLEYTVINQ